MEHQAMSSVTQETKKKPCLRCEKEGRDPMRPVSEFGPNKSARDGLQRYCRPCQRAYEREFKAKRAAQKTQQQQVVVVAPQQDDYIIPEDNREYIYLTYADTQVPLDPRESDKRMVNVTEMFKASGAPEHKKPAKWVEHESTQELIEEVLKSSQRTSITETRKGTTEGGQRGGGSTWYCEELALAYAMYLSPALHLACLRFVLEHWHGGPALPAPQADDCTIEAQRINDIHSTVVNLDQRVMNIEQALEGVERIEVARHYSGGVYIARMAIEELKDPPKMLAPHITYFEHHYNRGYELICIGRFSGPTPYKRIREHHGKLPLGEFSQPVRFFNTDEPGNAETFLRNHAPRGAVKVGGVVKYKDWFFVLPEVLERVIQTWPKHIPYHRLTLACKGWEFNLNAMVEQTTLFSFME
jgi:hypothetical protein